MLAAVPLTNRSTPEVCVFPDPSVTAIVPWWKPTEIPVAFTVNWMLPGAPGVTLPVFPPLKLSQPLSEFAPAV
jgi:hypothetical protein